MSDTWNLQRFIEAQNGGYGSVLQELRTGRKLSHWMWYIFPQVGGLGGSAMSWKYAISSRDEARAYWGHPVLGSRLRECTQLVIDVQGRTVEQIFSYPDNLKFHSCMTLFEASATDAKVFAAALLKYFGGERDQLTLDILETR